MLGVPAADAEPADERGLLYRCRNGHIYKEWPARHSYHPCPVMVKGHACEESSRRIDDALSVAAEHAMISVPASFRVSWSDIHGDETPRSLGQKGIERYNPSQVHTSNSGQGNWRKIRQLKKEKGMA
jgi:hypothetical protein